MLVTLEDITINFTKEPLLQNINLRIEENDRIGLVGDNGTGKSTLLNIICDKIGYDKGNVYYKSNLKIGYLQQNSNADNTFTIIEDVRGVFSDVINMGNRLTELEEIIAEHKELHDSEYKSAAEEYSKLQENFDKSGGYSFETDIKIVLNGMGFGGKDLNMKTSLLSGGEKTRLELCKLLLKGPELLVLDEPTNHLDFETLMWLEDYLAGYKGAIISVSHDRYFLDKTASRIWEIENKSIIQYKGNYSKYKILREERLQNQLQQYEAQQEEIAKMKDYISRNITRASTSNSAKSRVAALERMDIIEKPRMYDKTAKLKFTYDREPVKRVLEVNNLELTVGDARRVLASGINFELRRGDKIAVIGANGVGKSTFLKSILKYIEQNNGKIIWGQNVNTSFYEQENAGLNPKNTAIEELWTRFPRENELAIRSALARVLLQGDNVFKPVSVLSGGEKAKLSFAAVLLEKRNTLILDEPTNHLDLNTKSVLEQSLVDFEGTLLFVSHDRYLLNKVPVKIAELTKDGFVIYDGNFDSYIEKKQALKNTSTPVIDMLTKKETTQINPNNKKIRRAEQTQKRIRISQNEKQIAQLEQKIEALTAEMSAPENSSDYQLISRICSDLEIKKAELNSLMEEWVCLNEE